MQKSLSVLLSLLLALLLQAHSQTHFVDGGYLSYEEFKAQTPKFTDSLTIRKRTMSDIKAWGGNDYKAESMSEKLSKKVIKNQIWGICKNDTLYLNGLNLTGLIWFARVEIYGNYCFLKPSFPANKTIQKELGLHEPENLAFMFGMVGGAIAGAEMAVRRIPLILDLKTDTKMVLSKENICKLLDEYTDLKSEFEAENLYSQEILLKYLTKINEARN